MKCKICSGPLKILLENKLAECPLCNTIYRLPIEDEYTRKMDKLRPFMHRAEIYLSDGIYDMAETYFDKALAVMYDCPTAHLGKCLAD